MQHPASPAFDGFETARMRVRHWGRDVADPDFRNALPSILTPSVLVTLPPPMKLKQCTDAISSWIRDRNAESDVYTIRTTQTGDLIGLLILAQVDDTRTHLGYLFDENVWGKGYATELLVGLIWTLRDQSVTMRLIGGVAVTNPASVRVLQKAGFTRDAALSTNDTDMFVLDL